VGAAVEFRGYKKASGKDPWQILGWGTSRRDEKRLIAATGLRGASDQLPEERDNCSDGTATAKKPITAEKKAG